MRRKVINLLCVCTLAASLLAGCGDGPVSTNDSAKSEPQEIYEAVLPTQEEQAEIFVQKIDGLSEDFIKGMDISSLLSEEASGVVYYNENGEEEDLMKLLADAGINYVRVRVWNDPFDADGNGYGGGNCNAQTAAEIGKRAAAYGMKICVDFHYSDFWADPSKQFVPKAWKDMSLEEKSEALYEYTKESLQEILDAGADVGMVQIGNEINYGMAGEKNQDNIITLLKSGSKAVREVAEEKGKDIQIAVHYTEIDNPDHTLELAGNLDAAGLDYDIFGVSYYCFWHGTMENMTKVLSDITAAYGVKTCVMETSYMYTGEDGDGSANSLSEADALAEYPVGVQGQANCVRDVMAAASDAGALGVFYWEGAWIPVDPSAGSRQELWESKGSGWASSYAGSYDPNDAGKYYGGSSWDNQAFFDFTGEKLPSLDVFKYVNYGAVGEKLEVLAVTDINMEINAGEELVMPEGTTAIYNDSSCTELVDVEWDAGELAAVDTSVAGKATVHGTTADGQKVTAVIKISSMNYLKNPSFEDADMSVWNVEYEGSTNPTDVQKKAADAVSGEYAFHFWSQDEVDFNVSQTISGLPAGTYEAAANIQGGDVGDAAEIYLYIIVGDTVYQSNAVVLDGWVNWKAPSVSAEVDGSSDVTVGMSVKCAAEGWGTIDDFEFYSVQ